LATNSAAFAIGYAAGGGVKLLDGFQSEQSELNLLRILLHLRVFG